MKTAPIITVAMRMKMVTLCAVVTASVLMVDQAAFAEEQLQQQGQQVPAGEKPVDPYVESNENAGAKPFPNDALYHDFGGMKGISNIVNDLIDMSSKDERIEGIFRATDLVRLRRTLKEQVCYILGGPCNYTGRDMKESHKTHGISMMEFNALVELLQVAMDNEGVPFRAQNKLLAKLAPMYRDIVLR